MRETIARELYIALRARRIRESASTRMPGESEREERFDGL
jgi:hypothetical protein